MNDAMRDEHDWERQRQRREGLDYEPDEIGDGGTYDDDEPDWGDVEED